jgi:hypothetical protein
MKTLAGFNRVNGSTYPTTVEFKLTAFDLSVVGTDGLRHAVSGKWKIVAGLPNSPEAGPTAAASVTIM